MWKSYYVLALTISHSPQKNGIIERKKIELFLTWLEVCWKVRRCLKNFKLKLLIVRFIYQIVLVIKVYGIKHQNNLEMENNQTFHIWECLEALHIHMCRIKNNQSWIKRGGNTFSLVMTQAPKVTRYTI